MMDRRRMDAEGSRVVHRERRARKLALVVAVQNVLVVACLLATLYGYWGVQRQEQNSDKNIHIEFGSIADSDPNEVLVFKHVESSYQMSMDDNKINISCSGPYFLNMDVCYKSLEQTELSGTLQLEVVGRNTPETAFALTTADQSCRWLHQIVYLRAKELTFLRLVTEGSFKIKNATLSLTYLLGRQCQI